MLNQNGGSRTDTVIKLALVFIISLLSFSIGTFVGQQFSDQQHRTAAIENVGNSARATASISPDSLEVKPEDALTDADIASITEEFANAETDDLDEIVEAADVKEDIESVETANANVEEINLDKNTASVSSEEIAKPASMEPNKQEKTVDTTNVVPTSQVPASLPSKTEMPKNDMVAKTAVEFAKGNTPEVKEKPKKIRVPTSLPAKMAKTTVGKYTVQLASYQLEVDAKKHAGKLVNQGYSAFYVDAKIKGKTWYRVNVGLFANRQKAKVFRKQLMKEANLKSALIQKVVR
ncbi:MAG: SPOR domain-containing protein [Bdellovibrionales bacterium]